MIGENNPNFRNASIKTFNCSNCGKEFNRKTYGNIKTCSKECLLSKISKTHTGKIIFNKRPKTHLTYDKIVCKCGNKKDPKAETCINCFQIKKKRHNKNCVVCNIEFEPKTNRSKTCSKKCLIKHFQLTSKWDRNPNWKGGVCSLNQVERRSNKFKEWRLSVFERDKYTCQDCGKLGGTLHAHHILPFATYKELRFEISNGKTLCYKCHKTYHPSMNFKNK